MALTDGMRGSLNVEEMRNYLALLPLLLVPVGLSIAAWVAPIVWRWRIAVWVAIWSLTLPAFF